MSHSFELTEHLQDISFIDYNKWYTVKICFNLPVWKMCFTSYLFGKFSYITCANVKTTLVYRWKWRLNTASSDRQWSGPCSLLSALKVLLRTVLNPFIVLERLVNMTECRLVNSGRDDLTRSGVRYLSCSRSCTSELIFSAVLCLV